MAFLLTRETQAALAALESRNAAMAAEAVYWSAINSGSGELAGLARMAAPIEAKLAALPGAAERIPLPECEIVRADGVAVKQKLGEALRLRVRPAASSQIAFTGHYDTVFPTDHPFQQPVRVDDNRLRGPGIADMKGGLIVMLEALAAFERTSLAANVGYQILISPDEEIGSPGTAPLLAALGASAHVGMTYEPALPSGALASARKGSGNFSLVFTGRAAHVGRAFDDGRNAIVAAAAAATQLDAMNGRFDGVTLNVGAIEGGGPTNVVPETAVLRFNLRIPDLAAQSWALDEIHRIAAAVDGPNDVAARLYGGISRPPKPMNAAQEALFGWAKEAGAAAGLDLAWAPTGGVCEGNNLFAAGCPNIDTLGVRGGELHSDQEFALIDSFAERAKLSFLLLCGFAAGAWDVRGLRG